MTELVLVLVLVDRLNVFTVEFRAEDEPVLLGLGLGRELSCRTPAPPTLSCSPPARTLCSRRRRIPDRPPSVCTAGRSVGLSIESIK